MEYRQAEIEWGIDNNQRADVVDVNANPFPLGRGMSASSTESQKKIQAKADLTPNGRGRILRDSYWSSALTIRHEQFHISDWRDNYHIPAIYDTELWIESQFEGVTLANLDPNAVLNNWEVSFNQKYIDKTIIANTLYNPDKENRAYADGASAYQALADSIVP